MNWKNLQDNRCPQCNCYLIERHGTHACVSQTCEFAISHAKFEELVNKMYQTKPLYIPKDNQEELNNFGHSLNPEGFLKDEAEDLEDPFESEIRDYE